jgi:hypothetical protein
MTPTGTPDRDRAEDPPFSLRSATLLILQYRPGSALVHHHDCSPGTSYPLRESSPTTVSYLLHQEFREFFRGTIST